MKGIVGLHPRGLFLVLDASPFPSAQARMLEREEEGTEKGEKKMGACQVDMETKVRKKNVRLKHPQNKMN